MIHSFHFLGVEIYRSLFCTLSTVTIHRVCPACCLNPGATILRMCHAWMGVVIARQFRAYCTTWRVSELLQNVLRDFHVPWHWDEWLFIPTQYWAWNIWQYISQNSRGGFGEPMIASKSAIVVSSGTTFTALDLTVSPSGHKMFFGVETFSQLRVQVPNLSHD